MLPEAAIAAESMLTLTAPLAAVFPRPSVVGSFALPPKTVVSFSVSEFVPNVATDAPLMARAVPFPPALPLKGKSVSDAIQGNEIGGHLRNYGDLSVGANHGGSRESENEDG